MSKSLIRQANNNTERQETYRYLTGRYKMSIKAGFYFEALMIVYAMQEDRLKSLLYYAGTFENRSTLSPSRKTYKDLRFLLKNRYGDNEKLVLTTITGKIKLLDALLFWSESAVEEEASYSDYLVLVKRIFECVDIEDLRKNIEGLQEWLKYRNEIIHASMNKNITELYDALGDKVEIGMEYARTLDAYVKIIKKDNSVRKKLGMLQE